MNDELDPLRAAWAAQTVEIARFSEAELRAQAGSFDRAVRRRNLREYVAGAGVIVAFLATAWMAPAPLARVGAGLVAAGAAFVVGHLYVRGTPDAQPQGVATACIAWRRRELVRQRDLLAGIWRWYLGPLVPGLALMLGSAAVRADGPADLAVLSVVGVLFVLTFGWIARLNHAAAAELQVELDLLGDDDAR